MAPPASAVIFVGRGSGAFDFPAAFCGSPLDGVVAGRNPLGLTGFGRVLLGVRGAAIAPVAARRFSQQRGSSCSLPVASGQLAAGREQRHRLLTAF